MPGPEVKPCVKELLAVLKKCSIYLIGPMGSGKSTLSKYLAYELGFRHLDTDELVTAVAKKSISDIFAQDGEESFRDLEAAVLSQVAPFIGCVVATGGGVVLRRANWGMLQTGIVVYLESTVDVLAERLADDTGRPLLQGERDEDALRDRIEGILEQRRSLYEQADVKVHVDRDAVVDEVAEEVVRRLSNFIKENPPRLSKLYPGSVPDKS